MNRITFKLILLGFVFFSGAYNCDAQILKRAPRNPERELFGKSLNTSNRKVRESRGVRQAKKKQADNQKRLKKEYAEAVKKNRARYLEIQSPEVRERIVENRKEADLRSIERKKQQKANSRNAARKYR